MALAPGTRVDRYVVESVLGSGGMADVYAVRHATLGSRAALKVLRVHWTDKGGASPWPQLHVRMVREGRAQARLNHPNVVPVLDLFDVDGAPGLLMERIDGPTLATLLSAGPLPLARVEALARGLMLGLHAAHQLGIVHRDLKPANVLVAPGDVPRIADFGLATALADDTEPGITRPGTAIGTPAYMAPEQHEDASTVDARADVFALGVVLYEMVCGAAPAAGANLLAAWQQMSSKRWRSVSEAAPGTPERIERAIAMALEPGRDARPPSVAALWQAFFGEPFPASGAAAPRDPGLTVPDVDLTTAPMATAPLDRPEARPPSGIPKPSRALVGRVAEMDAALDRFDAGGALVTLVGTAGVGKTRIAAELAARWRQDRRQVLWFELAAARDDEEVLRAVACQLEETFDHSNVTAALIGRILARRGALLLVLDNFEQLSRAASQLVAGWVRSAPSLRVLATSRQPLGAPEEHVVEVPPIALPDTADDALTSDAWMIFAAAARPGALDAVDGERARRILDALDGLPLALELAAARLDVLTVDELEARLSDRFAVLTDPGASGERHGALYDAIAWSWALLSEAERSVLAEASAFASPFTLEAAEAIVAPASGSLLDALHGLVRRSLVRRVGARFGLLSAIRDFAGRHLSDADRRAVWLRHATWYADRAMRLQETGRLGSTRAATELTELAGEFAEAIARARLEPSLGEAALGCALGRCALYEVRGPMTGLLRVADEALALGVALTHPVVTDRAASLRIRRALALRRTGHLADAEAELESLASVAEGTLGPRVAAVAYANLADVYRESHRDDEAAVMYTKAIEVAGVHGPPNIYAVASGILGSDRLVAGEVDRGTALIAQGFAAAPHNDVGTLLELHKSVGWARIERDELDEAEVEYRQVLALADRIGARRARSYALGQLGLVAECRGDLPLAEERFAACSRGMREDGDSRYSGYYEGFLGRVRIRAGDWEGGAAVLRRALAGGELTGPPGGSLHFADALALARARLQRDAKEAARRAEHYPPDAQAIPGLIAQAFVALDGGDRGTARAIASDVQARAAEVDDFSTRQIVLQLIDELTAESSAWRIAGDGSGAESPDGARIALTRHAANARILAFLARMRTDRPGVGTDAVGLAGAGWPGERIVPAAAANRVRVALSALRRAGFASLIERTDGGWRLDPNQPVRYPDTPSDGA